MGGGGSGKKPGLSNVRHPQRRDTHKMPPRLGHDADVNMDARRVFPGVCDSSACASATTLHVGAVYLCIGWFCGGMERGQFSQRQWMGSRWTGPARVPPLGKACCMTGLARIPSDARSLRGRRQGPYPRASTVGSVQSIKLPTGLTVCPACGGSMLLLLLLLLSAVVELTMLSST